MECDRIDPGLFVQTVQPLLERQDLDGLLHLIKQRWSAGQILDLFHSHCCDARKVAALAVGLVGSSACLAPLHKLLKDPDPMVNQMAEHALWSIWFRMGGPEASQHLARGARALNRREPERALDHFNCAINLCPDFAEAYNQRAITFYLQERFDQSLLECRQVVQRLPDHFGAWSGMGHCHAHLGEVEPALRCYEKALAINPHLHCIREAVEELRSGLCPLEEYPSSPDRHS